MTVQRDNEAALKKLNDIFEGLVEDIGQGRIVREELDRIKIELTTMIMERVTLQNLGSDGQPLRNYSDEYAAFKKSTGRNDKVDHTFTGHMWSAFTAKVESDEHEETAVLFFDDTFGVQDKTSAKTKAAENEERRPFLEPTAEEVEWVERRLLDAIIRGVVDSDFD